MKKWIPVLILVGFIAAPGLCGDAEPQMDLDQQARVLQLKVESEMAEIQIAKARLELEHMEQQLRAESVDDDDDEEEEFFEALVEHGHALGVILVIINILAAIWVYGDMQGRPSASWIWVALVLLGGLCATIAYGVIRIGDCVSVKKE